MNELVGRDVHIPRAVFARDIAREASREPPNGEQWDGKMTCGFTAGTGKSAAGHTIESWQLYEVTNEQPQEGGGGGGILGGLFQ